MLTSLHIENLRGIERLDIEGLGRVNLIVGRNEAGKTTVLASAGLQAEGLDWPFLVPQLSDTYQKTWRDLDLLWLPLFRFGNTDSKPTILGTDSQGVTKGLQLQWARGLGGRTGTPPTLVRLPDGSAVDLDWKAELVGTGRTYWSPGYIEPETSLFEPLKELYLAGSMDGVLRPMRSVNPALDAVEIVGSHIYVRFAGSALPLPYTVLGDGARRLLEFAVGIAVPGERVLVDEAENGFHWTTLRTVWEMFRTAPPHKQIFATTHREELVRIACEVFRDAGDDGLRVIRLERTDQGHRAVVYTAEVALAALDSGLEIRG